MSLEQLPRKCQTKMPIADSTRLRIGEGDKAVGDLNRQINLLDRARLSVFLEK